MSKLDGRRLAAVPQVFSPKHRVTNAAMLRALNAFIETGHSTHSKNATLLPYIIDYCHKNGIGYMLTFVPGGGYYIKEWGFRE